MHPNKPVFIFLLLFFLIEGCTQPRTPDTELDDALVTLEIKKQNEIAFKSYIDANQRIARVAYPLLKASTSLCGEHIEATLGFTFANRHAFPSSFHETAASLFDMGETLKITQIIPHGPAQTARLEPGDRLVKLNGRLVPTGRGAAEALAQMIKQLKAGHEATLSIIRQSVPRTVTITPENICAFPVVLENDDNITAYADGEKIAIAKGLIRFAETDQELAFVIAHELGHNAMDHARAIKHNRSLGSILDVLALADGFNSRQAPNKFGDNAVLSNSPNFEAEADYVALYMMARAGLEIENTARFWRRMAAEHPGDIQHLKANAHPATAERFVAIEKTIDEIQAKRKRGLPLVPEYKRTSRAVKKAFYLPSMQDNAFNAL